MGARETSRREALAAEYVELIGYDPFEDDPGIAEDEVARTLAEWKVEATERPEPPALTAIVVDGVTCANCGAPEVENPTAPVAEWRFNIRAFRVDDWSECRKCGCWFNLAGDIEAPPKERQH